MGIKTNELQQLMSIQGSDSILVDGAEAGTGRLTFSDAAEFFDGELTKPGTAVAYALASKQDELTGQPGQVVGFDASGAAAATRGWSNRDLLDNWYFPDPANQRGVSGTINTPGYFIDRWKLISGSVTLSAAGLVLNGTIAQILEADPGQAVTASCLGAGGILPAEYSSESKTFTITADGALVRAAKLELGSQQTLAYQDASGNWVLNDPPPNKALELLKCQRYFCKFNGVAAGVRYQDQDQFGCYVPTPVAMRTYPAITLDPGTHILVYFDNDIDVASSASVLQLCPMGVTLRIPTTKPAGNHSVSVRLDISLSADL